MILIIELLFREKRKVKKWYYSQLKDRFALNYKLLWKKTESYNLNIDYINVIMFDSFDISNHLRTAEDKIDLVSFNSTLIKADLVLKP